MNKTILPTTLSQTFQRFFDSEKSAGMVLIACTLLSIAAANASWGASYLAVWQTPIAGMSLEHWINDGLMAIFFLLIGLELERELYNGELSKLSNALLPMVAAIGGMLAPALIHFYFNVGTASQAGIGIPMATDIAFALAILALLGNRVPTSLKVFVVAFAVIDDLGAALLIALFYTANLSMPALLSAAGVLLILAMLNRMRVMALLPYLIGGIIMWALMLKSGVHATIAGIALAFAIPFSAKQDDAVSPSHRLEHLLHRPVAFMILPLFALANTGVVIHAGWTDALLHHPNSIGILLGLLLGKPIGITALCLVAVALNICKLPADIHWRHIIGAGMLGGIGFTMSIFITNLAFVGQLDVINASKMAILLASLFAGLLGYIWLCLIKASNNNV
jgi:NhaA family Na+:H+ antiporter